jgi:DegV family protein with EDD domain
MIKIIADTLSCLSIEKARELGVDLIPQIIEFGEQAFRDDTEIDSTTFLKKLRSSSTLPKTAAPPPAMYEPLFRKYIQEGHTVLVICPSAQVSGTVRSAEVAAKDFPNADIRVIDTKSIGAGLGTLVQAAVEWANQDLNADSIEKLVLAMAAREKIYFVVDTLEYLQRGGRIGKAQALFGSLLQVKPILAFRNGHTEPVESQRTKRRAMARIMELVLSNCPKNADSHLGLMQGDAMEDALVLAADFKQNLGISNVPIFFLPPAILVHAGPGAIGISYFCKE